MTNIKTSLTQNILQSKLIKFFIILIALTLTTGCYDYNELTDLAIINGMAIEMQDEQYKVTYEVINTSLNKDNEENNKSFNVSGTGGKLELAIKDANQKLNKKPFLEQLKIVIIDKNIDILSISDYIIRNNLLTSNFYLVLADNPSEIISYENKEATNNATYIYNILNTINYTKITNQFDFQINDIINKHKDIVIPKIEIDNNITFATYGIYKKNTFIEYLNKENLESYEYFIKKKDIVLNNNDNSIYFYKIKNNIKIQDNAVISFKLEAKIDSLNTELNLRQKEEFTLLEEEFTSVLQPKLESFLKYLQDKESDILGINYLYYLKKPNNSDDTFFKNADLNLEINMHISRPGLTIKEVK